MSGHFGLEDGLYAQILQTEQVNVCPDLSELLHLIQPIFICVKTGQHTSILTAQ